LGFGFLVPASFSGFASDVHPKAASRTSRVRATATPGQEHPIPETPRYSSWCVDGQTTVSLSAIENRGEVERFLRTLETFNVQRSTFNVQRSTLNAQRLSPNRHAFWRSPSPPDGREQGLVGRFSTCTTTGKS
jgi:hypothetical protein